MSTKRVLKNRWQEEPGASIRQRFIDLNLRLERGHGHSSDELFVLLEGLPCRDEVPSGRDLRGSDFASGMEMEFSQTDFSCASHLGSFFHCDLTGAKFDEASSERSSFGQRLDGASFRKVRFRSCYVKEATARKCCFDESRLYHIRFDQSDLSGSSFAGADCRGASFAGAILSGCDFRGANLDEAQFQNATIDNTTDLRGASLINAWTGDHDGRGAPFDGKFGNLLQATYDDTTRFGPDPLAPALDVLAWIAKVARRQEYGEDGQAIAAVADRIKSELRPDQPRKWINNVWVDDLRAQLNDRQRELYTEIQDEAFHSML